MASRLLALSLFTLLMATGCHRAPTAGDLAAGRVDPSSRDCLRRGKGGQCEQVCTTWRGDTCVHSCTLGVPCD